MKLQLYILTLIHKPFYTTFSLGQTCSNYGHTILIYLLTTMILNPTTTIWAKLIYNILQRKTAFKTGRHKTVPSKKVQSKRNTQMMSCLLSCQES